MAEQMTSEQARQALKVARLELNQAEPVYMAERNRQPRNREALQAARARFDAAVAGVQAAKEQAEALGIHV